MKVGYDLDGTLCVRCRPNVSYFEAKTSELRKAWKIGKEEGYKNTSLIRIPEEKDYIIITSRKIDFKNITLEWLKKNNLFPKEVHFMENMARNRENMIKYKSMKINKLGITKYYEDDEKIANKLKKLCENTQIVTVEPVIEEFDVYKYLDCIKKIKF